MIKALKFKLFRYLVSVLSKDYSARTSVVCEYCEESLTWHKDVPCWHCAPYAKEWLALRHKVKRKVEAENKLTPFKR